MCSVFNKIAQGLFAALLLALFAVGALAFADDTAKADAPAVEACKDGADDCKAVVEDKAKEASESKEDADAAEKNAADSDDSAKKEENSTEDSESEKQPASTEEEEDEEEEECA